MANLHQRAWLSLGVLAFGLGLLLFGPAGTFQYAQGWGYLVVFTGCSTLITLGLLKDDPALLARRLRGGPRAETRRVQKWIMVIMSLGFAALLVVPAFAFRLGGATVPLAGVLAGDALVALGFYFTWLVYRENSFTAAIIDVAADQKVVSTGPYALVRHPMYASALFYLAGTPLALGAYQGLAVMGGIVPSLIWRLLDEERFLARNLPGYAAYLRRVRYRLIPLIW